MARPERFELPTFWFVARGTLNPYKGRELRLSKHWFCGFGELVCFGLVLLCVPGQPSFLCPVVCCNGDISPTELTASLLAFPQPPYSPTKGWGRCSSSMTVRSMDAWLELCYRLCQIIIPSIRPRPAPQRSMATNCGSGIRTRTSLRAMIPRRMTTSVRRHSISMSF
jgi:hypothetical protein